MWSQQFDKIVFGPYHKNHIFVVCPKLCSNRSTKKCNKILFGFLLSRFYLQSPVTVPMCACSVNLHYLITSRTYLRYVDSPLPAYVQHIRLWANVQEKMHARFNDAVGCRLNGNVRGFACISTSLCRRWKLKRNENYFRRSRFSICVYILFFLWTTKFIWKSASHRYSIVSRCIIHRCDKMGICTGYT